MIQVERRHLLGQSEETTSTITRSMTTGTDFGGEEDHSHNDSNVDAKMGEFTCTYAKTMSRTSEAAGKADLSNTLSRLHEKTVGHS